MSLFRKELQSPLLAHEKGGMREGEDEGSNEELQKRENPRRGFWGRRQSTVEQSGVSTLCGQQFEQSEMLGAFFANERMVHEDKVAPPLSKDMTGMQYIDNLIDQQENFFHKKLPFEHGQYHQCIPNPRKENQLITVQIVKRALKAMPLPTEEEQAVLFDANEKVINKAMHFQKFKLQEPGMTADDESEDYDAYDPQESAVESGFQHSNKSLIPSARSGINPETGRAAPMGDILLDMEKPHEKVDPLTGVTPKLFADLAKDNDEQKKLANKFMECEEFAVIAFWDLENDPKQDKFKCTRHFYVPSPKKRMVREVGGTELYEVLYLSQHADNSAKDIFFFFEAPQVEVNQDLYELENSESILQCAFLRLDMDQQTEDMPIIMDDELLNQVSISIHCSSFKPIAANSVLHRFINDLDATRYCDQQQLPNPTIIDSVLCDGMDEANGKTVVFTAFLYEEINEDDLEDVSVESCWYPTVYFYDLEQDQAVWSVKGAEIFIEMTGQKMAFFLTNRIWQKLDKRLYDEIQCGTEDFSRFKEFDSSIMEIRYMCQPDALDEKEEDEEDVPFWERESPKISTVNDYKLTFGKNKNQEITESSKVIEAYMHNQNARVTLLYRGIGTFTFRLVESKPLTQLSQWQVYFKNEKFLSDLQFMPDEMKLVGKGVGEDDNKVDITINLDMENQYPWILSIQDDNGRQDDYIPELNVYWQSNSFIAQWSTDDGEMTIRGGFNQQTRIVDFVMTTNEVETRAFTGKFANRFTSIRGKYCNQGEDLATDGKVFRMRIAECVKGTLKFDFSSPEAGLTSAELAVELDFTDNIIRSVDGGEGDSQLMIEALEAVDSGELMYFIYNSSVSFFRVGPMSYVQSKLSAIEKWDENSNGTGVVESTVVLYRVSQNVAKDSSDRQKKKKTYKQEPDQQMQVKFYMNQVIVRTIQKFNTHVLQMGTSIIWSQGEQLRFLSSVIFEQTGSDELQLSFVTAKIHLPTYEQKKKGMKPYQVECEYPQSPVSQSWIVDYPLLAYKTFSPTNREIAIVHMAQNMPQRIINLGKWEFVCFVYHTQMTEQKLYDKQREANCDISFLVRDGDTYRLMSFKSDPWLPYDAEIQKYDQDSVAHSLYLFSGKLNFKPSQIQKEDQILLEAPAHNNPQNFNRRFNSDKIQTAQLITLKMYGIQQYMIILQFDDSIVQASLNLNSFEVICEPESMIRRHLVRGYNEKIFFAETQGNTEKIQKLEFHQTKANSVIKNEIWTLTGSQLVAFEADGQNIGNDIEEEVVQSLFVMDNQSKIYMIQNQDGIHYTSTKVIDFSRHSKGKEIAELRENDWLHVHVSERTISFSEYTYNLNSDLQKEISIPENYIGDEIMVARFTESQDKNMQEDQNDQVDDQNKTAFEGNDAWTIEAVRAMPETANIILAAQRNHREYCFVVRPAPGTRRISVVAYQQQLEIEQLFFVTNAHILLKFSSGKCVTFLLNGIVVPQPEIVQRYLDENSSIVSDSVIHKGKKTILLEQFEEKLERYRYVCLQFTSNGEGQIVGIFDDPVRETKQQLIENHLVMPGAVISQTTKTFMGGYRKSAIGDRLFNQSALQKITKAKAEMNAKNKVSFNKGFHITEKGEVIKIAAIVSENTLVQEELTLQERKRKKRVSTKEHLLTGAKKEFFVSILAGTNKRFQTGEKSSCAYKTVIIHCMDEKVMRQLSKDSEFCIVGAYLCMRSLNTRTFYAIPLRQEDDQEDGGFLKPDEIDPVNDETELKTLKRTATVINMTLMCKRKDADLMSMSAVPQSYHTAIHNYTNEKMSFHHNMVQFQVYSRAIIYDIDQGKEICAMQGLDQLLDPDRACCTGFNMLISNRETEEEVTFIRKQQLIQNEFTNLLFKQTVDQFIDGTSKLSICGTLYRSYSEIDLLELQATQASLEAVQKMRYIDRESITSIYQGHTIFSIFQDKEQVFEQILSQFEDEEFEGEDNIYGLDVENSYLKRLYRTLTLPTADWKDSKDVIAKIFIEENSPLSCWKKVSSYVRELFGMAHGHKDPFRMLGFKSVCHKSLHFENSRQRESLMQLAMMCQETEMNSFCANLEDLETIFESMTPVVAEFLDNAHTSTIYSDRIENLNWYKGVERKVIGNKTTMINQGGATSEVQRGSNVISCGAKDSKKIQNRQVEAKVMNLSWLHAAYKGKKDAGFQELIVALSQAPSEELFATELVCSLSGLFWEKYFLRVFWSVFVPFLFYFVSTIMYTTYYAIDGVEPDNNWDSCKEFLTRILVLVGTIYFSYFELIAMTRDGLTYFYSDVFNYIDLVLPFLQMYLIRSGAGANYQSPEEEVDEPRRKIASLVSTLIWLKAFYWLKLFSNTSLYIRLIIETIYDIRYFLVLFVFILMTFGNAILIMDTGRAERYTKEYFSNDYLNIIFDQYLLSMGEFNGEGGYFEVGADRIVLLIFIGSTFFSSITFLNMLIAIMGDTFAKVNEKKEQSALKEKINIIANYCFVVPTTSTLEKSQYMFTITPRIRDAGEGINWEGTVSAIKRHIQDARQLISGNFQRKLKDVQIEIKNTTCMFGTLGERITDNQNQVKKQLNAIENKIALSLGESPEDQQDQQSSR